MTLKTFSGHQPSITPRTYPKKVVSPPNNISPTLTDLLSLHISIRIPLLLSPTNKSCSDTLLCFKTVVPPLPPTRTCIRISSNNLLLHTHTPSRSTISQYNLLNSSYHLRRQMLLSHLNLPMKLLTSTAALGRQGRPRLKSRFRLMFQWQWHRQMSREDRLSVRLLLPLQWTAHLLSQHKAVTPHNTKKWFEGMLSLISLYLVYLLLFLLLLEVIAWAWIS